MSKQVISIDTMLPPEMAKEAEKVGVKKTNTGVVKLLVLAILAGAFISLGAIFYITATSGMKGELPYGLIKLIGGVAFSLGLILVIVAGAELFTGNALIVMALAGQKIGIKQLLKNWIIVYIGNFVGAMATAVLVFFSEIHHSGGALVGLNMLEIAAAKCELGFVQALVLGVFCNALVCLAVWLCFSARFVSGKILAILFPITAFVTAGFEHSVANMYFIPAGLILKAQASATFWNSLDMTPEQFPQLTWWGFLWVNLLPVTIGNIIGGGLLVGLVYWFVYIRQPPTENFNK